MHLEVINDHNISGIATVVIALCIYNITISRPILSLITAIILFVFFSAGNPMLTLMLTSIVFVSVSILAKEYVK